MRYIDADALLSRLPDDLPYKASVKRVLIQASTADVAPKSEVAREIFEEIENRLLPSNMSGEFRGDSVEWFDYFDLHIEEDIAELKKKYTERCPDCKHFVGCECFDGKTCDDYEEEKT